MDGHKIDPYIEQSHQAISECHIIQGKSNFGQYSDCQWQLAAEGLHNVHDMVIFVFHQKGTIPALVGNGLGTSIIQINTSNVALGMFHYELGGCDNYRSIIACQLDNQWCILFLGCWQ